MSKNLNPDLTIKYVETLKSIAKCTVKLLVNFRCVKSAFKIKLGLVFHVKLKLSIFVLVLVIVNIFETNGFCFILDHSKCLRNLTSHFKTRASWFQMEHHQQRLSMFPAWKRRWAPRRAKSTSTWSPWSSSTTSLPYNVAESTLRVLTGILFSPYSTRRKLQNHWRTVLAFSSGIIFFINRFKWQLLWTIVI